MTFMRFMIFVAMGFLWCGSQIVLYLVGGIISQITGELGGGDRYVWIALGNLIPLACITPFVGGLTDLFGRKNVALLSALLGMIGGIVCATTHNMNVSCSARYLTEFRVANHRKGLHWRSSSGWYLCRYWRAHLACRRR